MRYARDFSISINSYDIVHIRFTFQRYLYETASS